MVSLLMVAVFSAWAAYEGVALHDVGHALICFLVASVWGLAHEVSRLGP